MKITKRINLKPLSKHIKNKRPLINADWDAALSRGYSSMLGWLEYSLKRSLKLECADPAEVKMGTEHVTGTLNELNKYAGAVQYVKLWLEECVKNNSPEGNVGK